MTEEKALVAQAQGMSLFSHCSSSRIPVGKGNPIKKPRGKVTINVKIIFKGRLKPIKLS